MAIKKDNDDKLSNLKNKNKSESVKPVNKGTAPKKLAPLPQKKAVPEKKPVSAENKPKKRIVISNELPDYDAIRAEELEKDKLKKAHAEAERKAR
ncbi:MAG: hypothetical protein K2K91_03750, partial [Ruminococcus sp.]|nr:hypothetical protein [Ruminococcus sp.]